MKRFVLLLVAASCTCVPDPTDARFACTRDQDCVAPSVCTGGFCGPAVELCTNGADDDGDGATDCADPDCVAACDAGMPTPELACADGVDNDGDGKPDCADADCASACDGGAVLVELACSDGVDNDGDGKPDCADTDCSSTCDAGVPSERQCTDGVDNDADGKTDCWDPDCGCDAGTPGESQCDDSLDNDGDGKFDCADPDCAHRTCGPMKSSVCCGTSCVDLSQDRNNCGGCGLKCGAGQPCSAYGLGGKVTGVCGCTGAACPAMQICFANSFCVCTSADMCSPGEVCDQSAGRGACRYP